MPLLDPLRWLATAIPYPFLMQRKPMHRIDPIARLNQMDQMDQIAQIDQIDQIDQIAQIDRTVSIDPEEKAAGQAEACANPACGRAGVGPAVRPGLRYGLRYGSRHGAREPRRLEGRFLCSGACWSAMLRQRIEREFLAGNGAGRASQAAAHSHRVPLGLLLLSLGWITEEELHAAVEAQRKAKRGRIGEWLRRQTVLTEKEITRALAMQWNCPIFDLEEYHPQAAEIPREVMEICHILPLPARGRGVLFLAFESGVDRAVSYAVQHITGMRVEAGLAAEGAFRHAWTRSLALGSRAAAICEIATGDELYDAASAVLREPGVRDARLVRFHQRLWLRAFRAPEDHGGAPPYRDYLYLLPERASASLARAQ